MQLVSGRSRIINPASLLVESVFLTIKPVLTFSKHLFSATYHTKCFMHFMKEETEAQRVKYLSQNHKSRSGKLRSKSRFVSKASAPIACEVLLLFWASFVFKHSQCPYH